MGNRKQKAVGLQYSELRNSPPIQSAETQQGPLYSDSVDVDKIVGASIDPRQQTYATTPSECAVRLQQNIEKSSKSKTPDSCTRRKAFREDEKSYLKEVKVAISEGRVPQVKVVQDENGNIVHYKSHFFNAVKLATWPHMPLCKMLI